MITETIEVPAPPAFKRQLTSVGVTGTNGKTTTTAWVAAALAAARRPVVRATTVGMYLDEEELDLPRSYQGFVQAMRAGYERGGRYAALELTSEALMRGFAKAWPPEVGVFTNLSHDHLDAHGSPEHYLASKAQLFLAIAKGGTAVLNACDENAALLADVVPAGVRILHYGLRSRGEPVASLDLEATSVTVGWDGTSVDLSAAPTLPPGPSQLRIGAVGSIYAENALAAYLGAVAAGVSPFAAAGALAAAPTPPGRFEIVGRRPYVVVDFAHTPDAMSRMLAVAKSLCDGELAVVFGAGGNRDESKRAPMGQSASVCDHVILTSDNPRDEDPATIASMIRQGIEEGVRVTVELDRRRAIDNAVRGLSRDDVLVVAGRGHETEQIIAGQTKSFSDVEEVRRALKARRA
jgi:UDP-N-acetylmuramoyl-L-alanyl-D-glutamate--2,6-diaminopimelate ligase